MVLAVAADGDGFPKGGVCVDGPVAEGIDDGLVVGEGDVAAGLEGGCCAEEGRVEGVRGGQDGVEVFACAVTGALAGGLVDLYGVSRPFCTWNS
jgi:hypothetical protein